MSKQPWHIRDGGRFARERQEVEAAYPQLLFSVSDSNVLLDGLFPIRDGEETLDQFAVQIALPTDYPDGLPIVREAAGRIPKVADRHVGPETGEACVLLPEDRWRSWPLGSSLLGFLDGPLRNYFLGQAIVERGGDWPFGQWSHGVAGQMEYYRDVFGTDRAEYVKKYLEYVIAKKLKGHWECPCGSGATTRSCHMKAILLLREQVPRSDAQVALKRLRELPSS
jgi:hypothetical protein